MLLEGLVGAQAAGGLVSSLLNYKAMQDNLSWQKNAQRNTWAREDNAIQRRAADLRAAGLSKTLAAGSAASSGLVVSTTAPQITNPLDGVADKASALMQMKQNIAQSDAQIALIKDQQAQAQANTAKAKADVLNTNVDTSEKAYNLDLYKKMGVPTNTSSDVKTGVAAGNVVSDAYKSLEAKLSTNGIGSDKYFEDTLNKLRAGQKLPPLSAKELHKMYDSGINPINGKPFRK